MFLIEFIEFCRSKASNFVKNRLWHNCLPVNFVLFFTTPFSYYFWVTSSICCKRRAWYSRTKFYCIWKVFWTRLTSSQCNGLNHYTIFHMTSPSNFIYLGKSCEKWCNDLSRNILQSNMTFNLTAIYLLL